MDLLDEVHRIEQLRLPGGGRPTPDIHAGCGPPFTENTVQPVPPGDPGRDPRESRRFASDRFLSCQDTISSIMAFTGLISRMSALTCPAPAMALS